MISRFPSTSLRVRFALVFAGVVIVLISLSNFVIGQRAGAVLQSSIGRSLVETAAHMADTLDRHMHARRNEITLLAGLDPLRALPDTAAARLLLMRLQDNVPAFSWIGRTDAGGTVIAATGGLLEGADIGHRPVYLEALETTFIGDVHEAVLLASLLPNPTGEPMKFVDVSVPVRDTEGNFAGVLAAHLSWDWSRAVAETVLSPLDGNSAIDVFVISAIDDSVLLGPDSDIGQRFELAGLGRARSAGTWRGVETWPDDQDYLTGYAVADGYQSYAGLGWTVVARQPLAVAHAPVTAMQWTLALWGALLVTLFAALGWWIAGWVTRPLSEIAVTADRLRSGEMREIPQHRGITEIETLSAALRELLHSLTRMEALAHRDRLTGLANRIGLDAYLDRAGPNAARTDQVLAFLCLDLDGFKPVNDRFGHGVGDAVLQAVAQRLRQVVRGGDQAVRLGGDEFALILALPNADWRQMSETIAGRIVDSIAQPIDADGATVRIGCSIGIACWTPNGDADFSATMRMADEALYTAKRAGKGRVAVREA